MFRRRSTAASRSHMPPSGRFAPYMPQFIFCHIIICFPSLCFGSPAFGFTINRNRRIFDQFFQHRKHLLLVPLRSLSREHRRLKPSKAQQQMKHPLLSKVFPLVKYYGSKYRKRRVFFSPLKQLLFNSYVSLIVSIWIKSAPACSPKITTSLKASYAVSNSRSPIGFSNFPVGPTSRAV